MIHLNSMNVKYCIERVSAWVKEMQHELNISEFIVFCL